MDYELIKKGLAKAAPALQERLAIDHQFLAILQAEDVITFVQRQKIQAKPKEEQVTEVIDTTTQDIKGRYSGLITALTDTNQKHIVDLLSEKISQLKAAQGHGAVAETSEASGASAGVDKRVLAKKIMKGMDKERVEFLEKSDCSNNFLDHIKAYGVIPGHKYDDLKELPTRNRMRELQEYLPKRPAESQLRFARAFIETDQEFILEEVLQLTEAEIAYIKSMNPKDK